MTPSGRGGKCRRCSRLSGCEVGAHRGFHSWLPAGTPGSEGPAVQTPAGPHSSPPPASSLQSPSAGRSCRAAVSGRAGRGAAPALGCDLERFHFWILPGVMGEYLGGGGGGYGAGRGPVLGTPGGGGFHSAVSCTPRPRPVHFPSPDGFHSAVPRAVAPPQLPPPPRGLPTPGEAPSGVGGRRS